MMVIRGEVDDTLITNLQNFLLCHTVYVAMYAAMKTKFHFYGKKW